MSSNKYNSIRETLSGVMLSPVLLSTYLTPPGAFTVLESSMPAVAIVAPAGNPCFAINDIPCVKLAGVFSPLGDGFAPQTADVRWRLVLKALTDLNVSVGNVVSFTFWETNFNFYCEYDLFNGTVTAIKANLPALILAGATKLALTAEAVGDWPIAAYSMAPGWAAAYISFSPKIVVEHTFPMTA